MSHLAVELPFATTIDVDELAKALSVDEQSAERIHSAVRGAENAIGHEHPFAVQDALKNIAPLLGGRVESIVDHERYVDAAFSPNMVLFVERHQSGTPTIVFDTTDDEFYLASIDRWLEAYDETLYQEELDWTTVHLDSFAEPGSVFATIRHPRACDLAKHHQTIGGQYWECTDDRFAYAILENDVDLVGVLEEEGYQLELERYEPPDE